LIEPTILALVFTLFMAVVVAFQIALALGAPWGEFAMGGKYPGRFPLQMRIAAFVQAVLLVLICVVVWTRAGLVFNQYFESSKTAIWFVVAFCVLGAIMNSVTPSKKERNLWVPVCFVLLVCSLLVARS